MGDLLLQFNLSHTHPKTVISTEATHSSIVSRAVERPPHFTFAVAVAVAFAVAVAVESFCRHPDRSEGPRRSLPNDIR
jgi:hypothetical protein